MRPCAARQIEIVGRDQADAGRPPHLGHAVSRLNRLARQPLAFQRLGNELVVTPTVEHFADVIVGERGHGDDAGQRVRRVPAQPARQLGITLAALQRRIAADELDFVEENAPSGNARRGQQPRRKSQPLASKLRLGGRLDVEQFRRALLPEPGSDDRGAELAAAEEPGDPRMIVQAQTGDEPDAGRGRSPRARPRPPPASPRTRAARTAPYSASIATARRS